MKNWKRGGIALLCAAVLVGGYFVFRWRENGGHHPSYGDVATWIAAGVALLGAGFALWQLRIQGAAISSQLKSEGKRDKILDARLSALERQQATHVALDLQATAPTWSPEGMEPTEGGFYLAYVSNNSERPIRDVVCFISPDGGIERVKARTAGRYTASGADGILRDGHYLADKVSSGTVDVMRAGEKWGFVFSFPVRRYQAARMSVEFSDDSGVKWQIDHRLRLERMDQPQPS